MRQGYFNMLPFPLKKVIGECPGYVDLTQYCPCTSDDSGFPHYPIWCLLSPGGY